MFFYFIGDYLSKSSGLGFGGFLIGFGLGWVIFSYFEVTQNLFSWFLILAGIGVIIGAIFPRKRLGFDISGL